MSKFILLLLVSLASIGTRAAETEVSFLNDWKWEGQSAPLLMALDEGYYTQGGLKVTMDPGNGSVEGLGKVDSGEYDFGSVDINSLIRYKDQNPESQLKAIYVIYNSPPFSIIGRRSQGVVGPHDLQGRTLGAPTADAGYAQWPAFAEINQIDPAQVTVKPVSFAERETKLAHGDVDAIAGYSFSTLRLQDKGVPINDISLMLMSDFGLDLYGNVIIVNPEFATNNPSAVRAFLKASAQGYLDTIANPAKAVQYVLTRSRDAQEKTELRRLIMAIGYHIITDEVREYGIGDLQQGRLEKSIEQISKSYNFTHRPSATDIFDGSYLSSQESRKLVVAKQAPVNESAVPALVPAKK